MFSSRRPGNICYCWDQATGHGRMCINRCSWFWVWFKWLAQHQWGTCMCVHKVYSLSCSICDQYSSFKLLVLSIVMQKYNPSPSSAEQAPSWLLPGSPRVEEFPLPVSPEADHDLSLNDTTMLKSHSFSPPRSNVSNYCAHTHTHVCARACTIHAVLYRWIILLILLIFFQIVYEPLQTPPEFLQQLCSPSLSPADGCSFNPSTFSIQNYYPREEWTERSDSSYPNISHSSRQCSDLKQLVIQYVKCVWSEWWLWSLNN